MLTTHGLRLSISVLCGALVIATAPVHVERDHQGPPQTAGAPAGPGQAPGQGRGRGLEPIQDYPADPNEVIQALHGFKVEVVAKADRPNAGLVDQHH